MTFFGRTPWLASLASGTALLVSTLAVHTSALQQTPAAPAQPPAAGAQQPPAPGRGRGAVDPALQGRGRRGGPPQPQQKQGVDYFAGTWSFTWTGRESPITTGPRQGTVTFTKNASRPNAIDYSTTGTIEDGAAFKESGSAEWDEAKKVMTFKETLANGTQLTGSGDWSSPLSIRYESQPVKIGGQSLRVRRTYSILAAHSFSLAEEISIDGGPFQRLGNGVFSKK